MTTKPTASEYLARSRAELTSEGGRIVQVRLRPAEVAALRKYREARKHKTDSDAIREAIVVAAKRVR